MDAGELTSAEYQTEAREAPGCLGRSIDTVALQREDIDVPAIWVDGVRCRRVGRWEARTWACRVTCAWSGALPA